MRLIKSGAGRDAGASRRVQNAERTRHPRAVDVVDLDARADAARQRDRQASAEVLAELLESLQQGVTARRLPPPARPCDWPSGDAPRGRFRT